MFSTQGSKKAGNAPISHVESDEVWLINGLSDYSRLGPYLRSIQPIWCCTDGLKTCCHINMSAWGDGWEPRIWRGGQQPQAAAQRPKGEHEMPISDDSPDAHAFWHCMHLAMFTGLCCFRRRDGSLVFSCFSLSVSPLSPNVDLSSCHILDRFVFGFCPALLLLPPVYFLKSVLSLLSPLGIASVTHAHRFLLDTEITGSVSLLLDLVARILLLN